TDHFFFRSNEATTFTTPDFAAVQICAFPVPPGTGSVVATWSVYDDMPRGSGLVRHTQYRYLKLGAWSSWKEAAPSGRGSVGSTGGWTQDGADLTEAVQGDSVQIRFALECQPYLGTDHT